MIGTFVCSCATSRRSTPSRLRRIRPSFSHCRLTFWNISSSRTKRTRRIVAIDALFANWRASSNGPMCHRQNKKTDLYNKNETILLYYHLILYLTRQIMPSTCNLWQRILYYSSFPVFIDFIHPNNNNNNNILTNKKKRIRIEWRKWLNGGPTMKLASFDSFIFLRLFMFPLIFS